MNKVAQVDYNKKGYNTLVFPARDMIWLLPGVVMFCLCFAVPYLNSFTSSFLSNSATPEFTGFVNYQELFNDDFYWLSLKNTMLFLLAAIGSTLFLSILISHTLFSLRLLQPFIALLLIPFFLPSSSLSALWRSMMGSSSWLVQHLHPKDDHWKFFSLLLLFIWKNIGAVTILIIAGLYQIEPDIINAGMLDGSSKAQLLYKIELPLLRHVITFIIIYLLMNGVRIFRESYLLYGAYPPKNLYFIQHYINGYFARLDYGLLSSAAVIFSHIVLFLFYIMWCILRKGDYEQE